MSTNYYLRQRPDCPCCGRSYEPLHIGKSSIGWCFGLHVIPDDGINCLDDWRQLWTADEAVILDEYGQTVTTAEMEDVITNRDGNPNWDTRSWSRHYRSECDFHHHNHSQRGPRGLLRHCLEPGHCTGHGEGTWDHLIGYFS